MKNHVEDKVILITCGSSGYGLQTARLLLELGAKVVITGRNEARLKVAQKEIHSKDLLPIVLDATKTKDWHNTIEAALEDFGRLDVLWRPRSTSRR